MKYNILEHSNAAIILFKAFCKIPLEKFNYDSNSHGVIDLVCTVNGVEVDIIKALDDSIREDIQQRKIDVAQAALDIVQESGLEELRKIETLLRDARYDIKKKIEDVTGVQIDMEDD